LFLLSYRTSIKSRQGSPSGLRARTGSARETPERLRGREQKFSPARPTRSLDALDALDALEDDYEKARDLTPDLSLSETSAFLISTARLMSEDVAAWQELYGRKVAQPAGVAMGGDARAGAEWPDVASLMGYDCAIMP
jgi:hypothetical protein